ncbi:MAG: DNA polymerase III subunit delta [Gammaproteobacteria bacterium]|nr:DNA polymerase III subunit delta [Gammaproteobacteria bacterium]
MKIYQEQLSAQLNKQLAPIYIISGEDQLLVNETISTIRQQAQNKGHTETTRLLADRSFDWQNLLLAADNQSLFAEKKIIELKIPTGKPGDKGSKALINYAEQITPDNVLLIISEKLDKATQNTKWFKAVEKKAVFIPIWPPTGAQLPKWLSQRLSKAQLTTTPDGLKLLAEYYEGNLLAAAQEIEKLRLIHGAGAITAVQIIASITDSSRHTVFDLIDTAIVGNCTKAVRVLHILKQEKTEPTIILWAFTRELRTLIKMASEKEKRQGIEQILQQYHVWEKRKPIMRAALQHNKQTLENILSRCATLDKIIKGAEPGNVWDAFEQIIMAFKQ